MESDIPDGIECWYLSEFSFHFLQDTPALIFVRKSPFLDEWLRALWKINQISPYFNISKSLPIVQKYQPNGNPEKPYLIPISNPRKFI